MNIFVVCPVRRPTEKDRNLLTDYVARLEKDGHRVHWPPRNTKQDDPEGGMLICRANFWGIWRSKEIHVFYRPDSEGTIFDLGIIFVLKELIHISWFMKTFVGKRKVVLINREAVIEQIQKERSLGIMKSFARVLLGLAEHYRYK